jgi:hypothetical protein
MQAGRCRFDKQRCGLEQLFLGKGLCQHHGVAKTLGQRLASVAGHEYERDIATGQRRRDVPHGFAPQIGIQQRAVK